MTDDAVRRPTFGTDGWRDVIAAGFTFSNLGLVAQAYADVLKASGGRTVLVGHDTRFLGTEFAGHVASVLAGNGLEVQLSESYLPTPALSFAVRQLQADGGVMITASHNPHRYQGFKLKGPYGGTATSGLYRQVEARLGQLDRRAVRHASTQVSTFDIRSGYFAALNARLDLPLLRGAQGLFIHDAMGGAAAGWLQDWFDQAGLRIRLAQLRDRPDPNFHGVNPEPIAANLTAAAEAAWEYGPLFVSATDGDGDRLGVVLPDGSYFNSHQIFAVLLRHLHARGQRGRVLSTFTVSRLIGRLARVLQLPAEETRVGFKYITEAMLDGDVLIGGEESGGIGVQGHLPERDGLLNSLLLLESVARTGQGLLEQFRELEQLTGWPHAFERVDLQLAAAGAGARVLQALHTDPADFAGQRVHSVERLDGLKLNFADGAWLLLRPSGTEPLLRLYCEAAEPARVQELLAAAVSWVDSLS